MNKQVVFPPLAIKQIANVMASQNPSAPNYMKGPELVSLFNALGYPDAYTFSEGRGIQTLDYGEGLSRLTYTIKRLSDLNKAYQIPNALQEFMERVKQPLEFVNSMQRILEPLNLQQFVPGVVGALDISKAENVVEQERNEAQWVVQTLECKKEEDAQSYEIRKRTLEESVLGEIPEGHLVVFISYSWDSEGHQAWVLKLAEDLANKGIFVLLDQYVDDGSMLPIFMDLGIERADKVLVIGTTKYKEKCYEPSSGVAFEGCIIRASISQNIGTKKFITCLKEGNFQTTFPLYIGGNKGHDFSNNDNYDKELNSLCRAIYGQPLHRRPKLGNIPDYAKE